MARKSKRGEFYLPKGDDVEYNPERGVIITGFDELSDRNLDVLSKIAHPSDIDNKRSFYRKKKASKSPKRKISKKKGCGCK